ncbi:phosphatidate cytidylyltransferase [Vibrio nigripulchritudo]|uniref:phosphatidate cytidylyltransferase n=1 Tax=Vibrio nigripulchritudo TaxID=28173 RepID=UPI0003B18EFE|nr:phosphatidate cytidylyltransferase [Vibrio nigripulchritudo]CCN70039.1 Phosphatidate cytidylyltransferase [Vibrio nigripulchritudo SFn118]
MKQRIITALILAPLVVLGIFKLSIPLFVAAIAAIVVVGFWEWTQFVKSSNRQLALIPSLVALAGLFYLLPFDVEALQQVSSGHVTILTVAGVWWLASSGMAMSFPKSASFWKNSNVLRHLFGLLTLIPFFTSVVLLRSVGYDVDPYYGAKLVLFVCFLVWAADSGAYFAGKSFGKRKMAPNVSPNKTIEGLVGGIITALVIGWGAANWFELTFSSPVIMVFITLATVIISVLGDLVESMFKRVSGIKDSGNIIPGHGGVLDRIDSLTAAFPVFALLYFTL